jgi:hypothetical protein
VADDTDEPSLEELAAMTEEDRIQYFLAHPLEGQDPSINPLFVARSRATTIPVIMKREEEQRRSQRAS